MAEEEVSSEESSEETTFGLTRRTFLKGSAAVAAGAAALSGLNLAEADAASVPDSWDEEADVVIVGSGFAGLAAGIEAAEAGSSVKVIEKMPIVGGNSRINGGAIAAVDNPKQREQGIDDSVELYMDDLLAAGRNLNHPELIRFLGENTWPAVEWSIEHLGVEYSDSLTQFGGHSVPRSYGAAEGSGWGIVRKELEKLEELGGDVQTRRKFTSFVRDEEGTIEGIEILDNYTYGNENSGTEKYVKANQGVVLASGGFGQDLEMRTDQNPSLTEDVGSTNHPGATGEVLREAMSVEANPIQLSWIQLGPWTSPEEKGFGLAPPFALTSTGAYGLWVNPETGKRFVNELADRRTRAQAELELGHDPEYPIAITDSVGAVSGVGEEGVEKRLEKGIVYEFESLDELASHFGIPAEGLKEQVEEYNEYMEGGEDEQFGKPFRQDAEKLTSPPWYAMRLWPKVHHTMGGVKIDTDAQVYDLEGNAIPNLYAAGEVAGGVHGGSRLGSVATADCLVYGRVAGANAAGAENPFK